MPIGQKLGPALRSGTIAGVFPSMPKDDDAWDADASREIARSGPGAGFYGAVPDEEPSSPDDDGKPDDGDEEEIQAVPVRRQLSLAIAGFAGLLGLGLALGAQTSAPDNRLPHQHIRHCPLAIPPWMRRRDGDSTLRRWRRWTY